MTDFILILFGLMTYVVEFIYVVFVLALAALKAALSLFFVLVCMSLHKSFSACIFCLLCIVYLSYEILQAMLKSAPQSKDPLLLESASSSSSEEFYETKPCPSKKSQPKLTVNGFRLIRRYSIKPIILFEPSDDREDGEDCKLSLDKEAKTKEASVCTRRSHRPRQIPVRYRD